jgi:hypothetical protein
VPIGYGQIKVIGTILEQFTSPETRQMVLAGSEKALRSGKAEVISAWFKLAVERMQAAVDEPTRRQVMLACGRNCAAHNPRLIQTAVARRKRFPSLDAYLDAEQRHPPPGTLIEHHGDRIVEFFLPRLFSRPMRCYCSLWRGLPEGEKVPGFYCQCSEGFVRAYWEKVLERPVEVELVESAISDSKRCQFIIHLV